ncbi:MAG: hypothetical protein AB2826_25785 [Candidatus Thiodiazotropha sp.]
MNNIYETISFWGGIASIVALLVIVIQFLRKAHQMLIEKKEEQDRISESIRREISEIAKKGTTIQRRQEIYAFVDSILSRSRHFELRFKIDYIFGFCALILTLCGSIFFVVKMDFQGYIEIPAFVKQILTPIIPIFFIVTIIFLLHAYRSIYIYTKKIDAFAKGFILVLSQHIMKTYGDNEPK